MQLPPPVHGVSVMSELIRNSGLINTTFACSYVNLATAGSVSGLQKGSPGKYPATLRLLASVLLKLICRRYTKICITLFPYGFSFYKDACVILLCRLFGYKPLLHLHTYGFKATARKSALRKRFYRFVFKRSEVICLSARLIEDIEELYTGRVCILPNGIPKVNKHNTYTLSSGPVKLLYLSNLIKGKGVLLLPDALELVKAAGYQVRLRIAGAEMDVSYRQLDLLIREKKLEKEISLAGPKSGEAKYREFREADIFLLPSNYDTFGLVLLEAMQFGVPCISTMVGGIPDVLGEGRGLLIPEINAAELAKAIIYLVEHPGKRLQMSQKAFDYFNAHYTQESFEQGLIRILNNQPLQADERLVQYTL